MKRYFKEKNEIDFRINLRKQKLEVKGDPI